LAGRACCRTGLLAGGAARASLAPGRTSPTGTRYGPGVLRTRGGGFGLGGFGLGGKAQNPELRTEDSPMRASSTAGRHRLSR
ncbi:MAG: hypothetical protein ACJAZN_000783, partial [Planctomycetota bacterium]